MVAVGFSLQPEVEFLDLLGDVFREHADYFEVAPETLWRFGADAALSPNGYHRRFEALKKTTQKPFVAHGVGYSVGSASAADEARTERWLTQLKKDHTTFGFQWYTDHLGVSTPAGLSLTLPLPLLMVEENAKIIRARLRRLQSIVPDVGVENTANYFVLGDPLDEPAFLMRAVAAPNMHLLLDLHNVYTMACNFGFDPEAYLHRLDLDKVIEIHVSGGRDSVGAWLPSGRVMRMDSHDDAIPEPVWALLEATLPRCKRLRGVTHERMEGTVTRAEVPLIRDELLRIRDYIRRAA